MPPTRRHERLTACPTLSCMDMAKLLGLKTSSFSEGRCGGVVGWSATQALGLCGGVGGLPPRLWADVGAWAGSGTQALGALSWVTFQVRWARPAELSEVWQGAGSRAFACRAWGPQSLYAHSLLCAPTGGQKGEQRRTPTAPGQPASLMIAGRNRTCTPVT